MTGFGLGWVNAAADYSRYLPRTASSRGVVGWTTFGGALAPVVLLVFGLLLAGSDAELSQRHRRRPDRRAGHAAADLVPRAVRDRRRARPDRRRGAGHLLVRAVPARGRAAHPAAVAAGVDGVIMVIGTIYVVFFADNFIGPFQGFLITLGVPIAAWCGVHAGRHRAAQARLRRGRAVRPARPLRRRAARSAIALVVLGTVLGWGLVTNTYAGWLDWQGYLLGPFGLGGKDGAWAFANLGVLVALAGRPARHAADRPRPGPGAGGGRRRRGDEGRRLRADGGADRAGQPVGRARRRGQPQRRLGQLQLDHQRVAGVGSAAGRPGRRAAGPRRPARRPAPARPPPARPAVGSAAATCSGRNSASVSAASPARRIASLRKPWL